MKRKKAGTVPVLALALIVLMSAMPAGPVFAGQEDGYHDPLINWVDSADRTGELDINDPLSRLGEAKGVLARLVFKVLNRKMEKDPSDGDMLYIFHLPLRATAKATGGRITENMVKDFLSHANGHGFGEIFRMIGHNFSDKKKIKAYRKKLEQ